MAIDPAAGRIYWSNVSGQKISFANLDGSGGGDLNTAGATVSNPAGVSIDPGAGKIYWASVIAGKISFARLDNSGGGDLGTTGATTNFPNYPVILKGPTGTAAPEITRTGGALSCSRGGWSADQVESFLYRAPSAFADQWSQDGTDIPGATGTTFTPTAAGHFRCAVTASNPAGSASQSSRPFAAFRIGQARRNARRGTARLPVTVPDPGTLTLTGAGARTSIVNPASAGAATLVIKARGRKRRKLNRKGRATLTLAVAYVPNGLSPSSETIAVRLRKR